MVEPQRKLRTNEIDARNHHLVTITMTLNRVYVILAYQQFMTGETSTNRAVLERAKALQNIPPRRVDSLMLRDIMREYKRTVCIYVYGVSRQLVG